MDRIRTSPLLHIPLFDINQNPNQIGWTNGPKAFAKIYIDDAALGAPLIFMPDDRSYVDWPNAIHALLP
jgi:hypothetical protein